MAIRSLAGMALCCAVFPYMHLAIAADPVACVKAMCEPQGRTCISSLYDIYEVCMTKARKACDAAPASGKFACLKKELTPCSTARNQAETACLDTFRSCYKACGPFEGQRADYWCVAELGKTRTASFCAADPKSNGQFDQCSKDKSGGGGAAVSMRCESL